MPPDTKFTSLTAAAELLGVSPRTLRRHIARGDLTAYYLGRTKTVRVSLDDVEKLLRPIATAGGDAS